jgi:hypothetical protein
LEWKKRHWLGQVPDNARDFDDNERRFAAAALVILFSLCEKLSTIRIADFPTLSREYLLRNNYGRVGRPGLQQLKTVEFVKESSLDIRSYEDVDLLEYIRCFGKLPLMKTLNMGGVAEYEINGLIAPGTSSIKNIHLSHAEVSGSTLCMIVRAPKALETLKISVGGLWQRDPGRYSMRPKELGKSLLQHRNTLKVLELDMSVFDYTEGKNWEDDWMEGLEQRSDEYFQLDRKSNNIPFWLKDIPDDRVYGSTIGSLHDFKSTTHLSIGISALLGPLDDSGEPPCGLIDALPPNLEYPCLYGYVKRENCKIDNHIEELLQQERMCLY